MTAILSIGLKCIRCRSRKTKPYGARFYCLNCGFTWHKDSTDEMDELVRRQLFFLLEAWPSVTLPFKGVRRAASGARKGLSE